MYLCTACFIFSLLLVLLLFIKGNRSLKILSENQHVEQSWKLFDSYSLKYLIL